MNIVQILGRVGRDPETRFTQSGLKVTTFSLAVNVRKGGQEETIWWRVTIWGDRFDKMLPFIKKGSALVVIGEMSKPNIYNDKEGRPQVGMEMTADIIKFVPINSPEGRPAQEGSNSAGSYGMGQAPQTPSQSTGGRDPYQDFGMAEQTYTPSSQSGTAQPGLGSRYASTTPADDQLPF